MSRLQDIDPAALSAEQRALHDRIQNGPRGAVIGPMRAWLEAPALGEAAQELGARLRFQGRLPARQRELAILMTAQAYGSAFEWHYHAPLARDAGLPDEAIKALESGEPPALDHADDRLIYACVQALLQERHLPEDLYDSLIERFGEAGVCELALLLGYYGMVALTLTAFDIAP